MKAYESHTYESSYLSEGNLGSDLLNLKVQSSFKILLSGALTIYDLTAIGNFSLRLIKDQDRI